MSTNTSSSSGSSSGNGGGRKRHSAGALVFLRGDRSKTARVAAPFAATARVARANADGSYRIDAFFPRAETLQAVRGEAVVEVADALQSRTSGVAQPPVRRVEPDATYDLGEADRAERMHDEVCWPVIGDRVRFLQEGRHWHNSAVVVQVSPKQGIMMVELACSRRRKTVRYPHPSVLVAVRKGMTVRNGGLSVHSEGELHEQIDENSGNLARLVGVQYREKFGADSWHWAVVAEVSQDNNTARVEYDDGQILSRTVFDVIEKIHGYRQQQLLHFRHGTEQPHTAPLVEHVSKPLDLQARKLLEAYQQQTKLLAPSRRANSTRHVDQPDALARVPANEAAGRQWEKFFRVGNTVACINLLDSPLFEDDATAITHWCLETVMESALDPSVAKGIGCIMKHLEPFISRDLNFILNRDYLSRFIRRVCMCIQKRQSRMVRLFVSILHSFNAVLQALATTQPVDMSGTNMPTVAREGLEMWQTSRTATALALLSREASREIFDLVAQACEHNPSVLDSVCDAIVRNLSQEDGTNFLTSLSASRMQQRLLIHVSTNSRISTTVITQQLTHLASASILQQHADGQQQVELPQLPANLLKSLPTSPLAEVLRIMHA